MRNDFIIGFSCCLLGTYNYYIFSINNKLFKLNSIVYLIITCIGIFFLLKVLTKRYILKKRNISNVNALATTYIKSSDSKICSSNQLVWIEKLEENGKKYKKIFDRISILMKTDLKDNYELKNIYKINNERISTKFKTYQSTISKVCGVTGKNGPANTNYLFHGTSKICDNYAHNENLKFLKNNSEASNIYNFSELCSNKDCSLCNISKKGFSLNWAGKGPATDLRYGKGIYFSPEMKKALQYTEKNTFLIYSKVCLGRVYFDKDGEGYLDEYNDSKFDSIMGSPSIDSKLKCTEICVFKEEACCPKYILEISEL